MSVDCRYIAVAPLVVVLILLPSALRAQPASPNAMRLPASVNLSDVEIRLVTFPGGGCHGRCVHYSILLRGDGIVELEDIGTPPRSEPRKRSIAADEVVALVNAFLKARFFETVSFYGSTGSAVRKGDSLFFYGSSSGTGESTELSLKLGPLGKTVRLVENVPGELEHLRQLVWQKGGPDAWGGK
jgi:hypothetical protein